ncbi:hypothetical protein [Streptomyces chartreusis]|uniref:hypothetical protein n=1 Tax=Streptomyces chartreusis TaxID=1969 RepID=UPI00339EB2E7
MQRDIEAIIEGFVQGLARLIAGVLYILEEPFYVHRLALADFCKCQFQEHRPVPDGTAHQHYPGDLGPQELRPFVRRPLGLGPFTLGLRLLAGPLLELKRPEKGSSTCDSGATDRSE